jgi:hypothetical protein
VDEVDTETIERHSKVGMSGQHCLLSQPVETVSPVGDELAQIVNLGPE